MLFLYSVRGLCSHQMFIGPGALEHFGVPERDETRFSGGMVLE
jgi:hypothetical protein